MNAPSRAAAHRAAGVPTDEFLLQIVNSVQSPVFVKDEQLRFVLTNEAFCKLVGRPNNSLLGLTDYDIVPREQAAFFQEIDRKVLATGAPHETEEMLTSADGAEYWLFTRKSMVEVASGERYLVGIISDITERKRMEKDLVAAKLKAEDANRAKSMFLANMSHELRTPLNAVIGFAEIIKDELLGAINEPRYRDYAADIHNSGKHLLRVINDILDMTKVEAGTYQLREDVCDVAKVVGDAAALVQQPRDPERADGPRGRAGRHSVPVRGRALRPSDAGEFPVQRHQVHAQRRRRRGLRAARAGWRDRASPSSTPASAWRRTTSRRRSARSGSWRARTAAKYEGTGLGLSLTKAMLELHEGTLQVDSKLGAGTTVTAKFPPRRTIYR